MIEQFIAQLSKELELNDVIRNDVPGAWALPIEEDAVIMISAVPPRGFALNCGFAACPTVKQEQFFERMLLGNLFGQGTKGATLGLNEDGNLLTLYQAKENAEYKEFKDILEDFINTVDYWREEVANWK